MIIMAYEKEFDDQMATKIKGKKKRIKLNKLKKELQKS